MPATDDTPPPYLSNALKTRLVPIDELRTLPGNPRRGDIERIKASLTRFGQRYPSVVRGDVLLAGNNRKQAMLELGWTHVVVVDADDLSEDEARAFALADNRTSDVASYDHDELAAMIDSIDAELRESAGYFEDDLADLSSLLDRLGHDFDPMNGMAPNDIGGLERGGLSENYSRKIESPIYEPTGPKPTVDALWNSDKTIELQTEILANESLTSDERVFLLAAAERHTVFKFDQIAEYYAHSGENVRRFMERSALVIIDLDSAIENGFVQISRAIAAQFDADQEIEHSAQEQEASDDSAE